MRSEGPLDYLTDDELREEWLSTVRDKHAAIERLNGEMSHERYVLALAQDRGLAWACTGPDV